MTSEIINGIIIFAVLFLLLVGVAVAVAADEHLGARRKNFMLTLTAAVFLLVVQNYAEYFLVEKIVAIKWRTAVAVFGYSLRPAIIVLFIYLVAPERKHRWAWLLVGINVALHCTAFFSPLVFYINANNNYGGGPLSMTCLVVSAILLLYHLIVVAREFKTEKSKGMLIPVIFALIVIIAIVFDIVKDSAIQRWVDYVTVSVVICCVFYYLWLHFVLVKRYGAALLAEQSFKTMLSQIQPHFIYNTLSAIRNIQGNPYETKQAVSDFAAYLRGNLSALDHTYAIPFEKEIEHVTTYINIEKLRFGDRIKTEFDLKDVSFVLPPLTVQIFVENAIKHGITKKYEGGTVKISTRSENGNHVIIIEDDGAGFDTSALQDTDRVGIRAAKNRLKYFVSGETEIKSEVGKGTTVILKIPDVSPPPRKNFKTQKKHNV